jgi:hypothetical protein
MPLLEFSETRSLTDDYCAAFTQCLKLALRRVIKTQ